MCQINDLDIIIDNELFRHFYQALYSCCLAVLEVRVNVGMPHK